MMFVGYIFEKGFSFFFQFIIIICIFIIGKWQYNYGNMLKKSLVKGNMLNCVMEKLIVFIKKGEIIY